MIRPMRSLVVVAAVFALAGCRPSAPSAGSAAPPAESVGPPVTDTEAWEFGERVTAALKAKDVPALGSLLRMDDLMNRAVSDYGLSAADTNGFRDGFEKSGGATRLVNYWVEQFGGSESKRLRVGNRDGRTTVLVRVVGEDGGLNYMEFSLIRTASGVAAEDLFVVATGEKFSQTVRRLLHPMLLALRKGSQSPTAKAELDRITLLGQFTQSFRDGQFAEAVRQYRRLPADMRDDKMVLLIGLQALYQAEDPGYLAEVERCRKLFPDDPSVELMSLDYHAKKKNATELRACLRRLDRAVGGDPYLWAVESTYLLNMGQPAEAREAAEKAVAADDAMEAGYWALAAVAVAADDHKETARVLRAVVEKFAATDPDGVAAAPDYARFAKSPEFAAFRQWYADRGGK